MSYFQVKTKNQSPIIDINNHLNQVLPVFDSLNKEFSLGFQSVDTSSDHFSSNTIFIISNISVKNILFTKAELFAIRYDISQSFQIQDVICIVIITNTILVAKRIFDLTYYPYQLYSIIISKDLRKFFNKNPNNTVTF